MILDFCQLPMTEVTGISWEEILMIPRRNPLPSPPAYSGYWKRMFRICLGVPQQGLC